MLLLFFFEPNRPCMNTIGAFWEVLSLGGSWRSYAILMPLLSSVVEKGRDAYCRNGCCKRGSALRANMSLCIWYVGENDQCDRIFVSRL